MIQWSVASVFVQMTVVPLLTVRISGTNVKFTIFTVGLVDVAADALVAGDVDAVVPPQPATAAITAAVPTRSRRFAALIACRD